MVHRIIFLVEDIYLFAVHKSSDEIHLLTFKVHLLTLKILSETCYN